MDQTYQSLLNHPLDLHLTALLKLHILFLRVDRFVFDRIPAGITFEFLLTCLLEEFGESSWHN